MSQLKEVGKSFLISPWILKNKYVVEDAANKEGEHNNAATSSNDIKADL